MDYKSLLILIAAIANFSLAIVVRARSAKTLATKYFEYTTYAIVMWCVAMFFYRIVPLGSAVWWTRVLYFFPTFIPAGFVLFGLHFSYKNPPKFKTYIAALSGLIIAFMTLIPNLIIESVDHVRNQESIINFGWGYYIFYIAYIILMFNWAILIHVKTFHRSSGIHKLQTKYILIGLILASLIGMISNLILPTLGYFQLNWVGQVSTFALLAPVAYAIAKHRLMDIRLVVARTVSYTLLILILSAIYATLLFIIGQYLFPTQLNGDQFGVSMALALILAYTFQPIKKYVERVTDNFFFKGRYDTQVLLTKLNHLISVNIDLEDLVNKTISELKSNLRIQTAFVVLIEHTSRAHLRILGKDKHFPLSELEKYSHLFSQSPKKILIFEELPENSIKQIMREFEIGAIIPLMFKHQFIGQLILGEKSSGDIYSDQDIQLLQILAPELSVAIQNANSFQEISNFNIRLKKEIKSATLDLREANKRLTELDKIKDEFLSIASHELRTPMTAIKSYLWMILNKTPSKDVLSDKSRQYLDRAYLSTDRLLALVNDMLDVSRIEAGRIELHATEIDLKSQAKVAVDELITKAKEKNIEINVQSQSPHLIQADSDKLHQVFINLIGNAIKFTSNEGKIQIKFQNQKDKVEVSITDTGKGISKSDMSKLFTKFGRLNGTLVSVAEAGGTGLGLYICNQIIKRHGGRIWVESQLGKGSTFTFSLPIESVF